MQEKNKEINERKEKWRNRDEAPSLGAPKWERRVLLRCTWLWRFGDEPSSPGASHGNTSLSCFTSLLLVVDIPMAIGLGNAILCHWNRIKLGKSFPNSIYFVFFIIFISSPNFQIFRPFNQMHLFVLIFFFFFQFSSIKFDSLCWSMQCERKMMLSLDLWLGKRKQGIYDKNKHFFTQLLWICETLCVFVSHYFPRKKRNTSQM